MLFLYETSGSITDESPKYDSTISVDNVYYVDSYGAYVYNGANIEDADLNALFGRVYTYEDNSYRPGCYTTELSYAQDLLTFAQDNLDSIPGLPITEQEKAYATTVSQLEKDTANRMIQVYNDLITRGT